MEQNDIEVVVVYQNQDGHKAYSPQPHTTSQPPANSSLPPENNQPQSVSNRQPPNDRSSKPASEPARDLIISNLFPIRMDQGDEIQLRPTNAQQKSSPQSSKKQDKQREEGHKVLGNLFIVPEQPQRQETFNQRRSSQPKNKKLGTTQIQAMQRELVVTLVPDPNEVDETSLAPSLEHSPEHKTSCANRAIGILLLSLMGILLWIFGFASQYRVVGTATDPVNTFTQPIFASLLTLSSLFAIIGFGLLYMYFKKMTESALFTSLFIVSYTMLISPMFQKFWYNIFISDFAGYTHPNQSHDYFLNQSMGGQLIYFDLYNMKLPLLCAISQLVVFLAIYGRLSIIQLITFSTIYNIFWTLNNYALINVQSKSPDDPSHRFYDDNFISAVYLFASCYGLFALIFLKKPPKEEQFQHSDFSAIFALIGALFIFLTFCTTSLLFSIKNTTPSDGRNFVWMENVLNCFFALSANVLTTLALSVLTQGKFMVRWSVFGLITGGIIYGSVSATATNIGAAIACGMGAGALTVIYYFKIYPMINRKIVGDSYGLFLILAASLIGTMFISPVVLSIYYDAGVLLSTLTSINNPNGAAVPNPQLAGYSLIYPAISILVGAGSGVLLTLLLTCFDKIDAQKTMTDQFYFKRSHGLRHQIQKKKYKPPTKRQRIKQLLKLKQSKNNILHPKQASESVLRRQASESKQVKQASEPKQIIYGSAPPDSMKPQPKGTSSQSPEYLDSLSIELKLQSKKTSPEKKE